MHLAHIVSVNSLAMINVPFQNAFGLSCSYWNLGYGLHFFKNALDFSYGLHVIDGNAMGFIHLNVHP